MFSAGLDTRSLIGYHCGLPPGLPSHVLYNSSIVLLSMFKFYYFYFKETIMNITEVSEAAITVRGTFFPPGNNQVFFSSIV